MRKITEQAVRAFENNRNFKSGNTQVIYEPDRGVARMFLWGNEIARKFNNGSLYISLCGYNTVTTRERLNGLCGVSLTTRNGQAILNGVNIDHNAWVCVLDTYTGEGI